MSYCRFLLGDVYFYHHVDGSFVCSDCRLKKVPPDQIAVLHFPDRAKSIEHLTEHIEAGHKFSMAAIDTLAYEMLFELNHAKEALKAIRDYEPSPESRLSKTDRNSIAYHNMRLMARNTLRVLEEKEESNEPTRTGR